MASFRSQDSDAEIIKFCPEIGSPSERRLPIYSRTVSDLQTWLSRSGKDLSSINVDEFLNTVCSAAAQENPPAMVVVEDDQVPTTPFPHVQHQNDDEEINEQQNLCFKTVEEVLADLQYDEDEDEGEILVPVVQTNMEVENGEEIMTLEEFMVEAGVVRKPPPQQQNLRPPAYFYGPNFVPAAAGNNYANNVIQGQVIVNGHHVELPDSLKGRKKVVERKQIRMIKNRESAARSRARKQAYTDELEEELKHLTRENLRLKKALAEMEREKRERLRQQQQQQRNIEEDETEMGIKSQRIQDKLKATRRTPSCSG